MLPPHLAAAAASDLGAEPSSRQRTGASRSPCRAAARLHWRRLSPRPTWIGWRVDFAKSCFVGQEGNRAWSTAAPRAPGSCPSPSTKNCAGAGWHSRECGRENRGDARLGARGRGWPAAHPRCLSTPRGFRSAPAESQCARSSRPGRALPGRAKRRRRNDAPPLLIPTASSVARGRLDPPRRLSRRGVGRAEYTTARSTRSSRSTSRPVCLDHDPAKARQFFAAPSATSSRRRSALLRSGLEADAERRHRAQPHEDRGHDPFRAPGSR